MFKCSKSFNSFNMFKVFTLFNVFIFVQERSIRLGWAADFQRSGTFWYLCF